MTRLTALLRRLWRGRTVADDMAQAPQRNKKPRTLRGWN